MKFRVTIFISLIVLVIAVSCNNGSLYEKNLEVNNSGWNINDSLIFNVEINDTISPVNFYLNLRHNVDYEYSNIYFFVNTVYPDLQSTRDTIQVLLAGKDGEWFGSGLGQIKENQVLLKRGVVFPMKGAYEFSFVQAMRVNELKGIEDIGIRIEKMQD